MFRSLMTIIRELYLYLTKVIFMLKHSVKLRRYKLGDVAACQGVRRGIRDVSADMSCIPLHTP